MCRQALPLLLAAASLGAGAALADPLAEGARYDACMERARAAPEEGLALAEAWLAEAETTAARHCRAAALIGLGRDEEGAAALEALGRRMEEREPALAADLYRQAALAKLEAGALGEAERLQDRALELAPGSIELLIDRALLAGARADYAGALRILEDARALAPLRADLLVLIASAHRLLGHAGLARESLEAAFALEPDHPAALLERGILRREGGDEDGARADWERLRTLAPGSPEADAASAHLALIGREPAAE